MYIWVDYILPYNFLNGTFGLMVKRFLVGFFQMLEL